MVCSKLHEDRFTGVIERPASSSQPFAVWFEGATIFFTSDRETADAKLNEYRQDGPPVDRKTIYNHRREDEF